MRATRLERRKRRRTGKKTKRYEIYVIEKDILNVVPSRNLHFHYLTYNQNNNSRGNGTELVLETSKRFTVYHTGDWRRRQ